MHNKKGSRGNVMVKEKYVMGKKRKETHYREYQRAGNKARKNKPRENKNKTKIQAVKRTQLETTGRGKTQKR